MTRQGRATASARTLQEVSYCHDSYYSKGRERKEGREGLQERAISMSGYEGAKREGDLPEVLVAGLLLDLTNSTATTSTRMTTTITTTTTPPTAPPTIPALSGTAKGNQKKGCHRCTLKSCTCVCTCSPGGTA